MTLIAASGKALGLLRPNKKKRTGPPSHISMERKGGKAGSGRSLYLDRLMQPYTTQQKLAPIQKNALVEFYKPATGKSPPYLRWALYVSGEIPKPNISDIIKSDIGLVVFQSRL